VVFTAADRRDPGQRTSSVAHPFASTVAALGDVRELTRARELLDGVPASDEHGVPWPVYTRMARALLVERSVRSARALDLADPLRHTTNVPVVTALTAKWYRRARHPKRVVEVSGDLSGVQPLAFVQASRLVTARLVRADETLAAAGVPAARLSAREREILAYLRTPMTAEEIAAALFVSVNTVRTHQRSIYRKLGVNSRRDAIKIRM